MCDLDVLLPKYTITLAGDEIYTINGNSNILRDHISIIRERINIIKEIHDNYDHILQFLSLNDFILQSDTKYPYYMHKFLNIRVCINIQSINVNGKPFHLVDEFYQNIRIKLNLE